MSWSKASYEKMTINIFFSMANLDGVEERE